MVGGRERGGRSYENGIKSAREKRRRGREGDLPLRTASFCELFFSCCGVERGWRERKQFFWGGLIVLLFWGVLVPGVALRP